MKLKEKEKDVKDYQLFNFNGTEAIKHKLNDAQIAEAIAQCNVKSAMAAL